MGTFRIKFEKTTLTEVRRAAAVGIIRHRGDAGESINWLCYTNVTPTHVERVWIVAGELDGPRHYVSLVSAEIIPNGAPSADCPALPAKMKPLSLVNGIWLQATYEVAHSKFGAPSYQKGAWQSYNFEGKVPGNCEGGGFDLLNGLVLRFNAGRVDRLTASQTTTC